MQQTLTRASGAPSMAIDRGRGNARGRRGKMRPGTGSGGAVARRAFMRRAGFAGAGLGALWLAACGGDSKSSGGGSSGERRTTAIETATAAQIKPGGTMRVVWETEPQG